MKKTEFKEKSSVLFVGKGIIILSLVITSSLSFVLGFLVGKSYNPVLENQISSLSLQERNTAGGVPLANSKPQERHLDKEAQTAVPETATSQSHPVQNSDVKNRQEAKKTIAALGNPSQQSASTQSHESSKSGITHSKAREINEVSNDKGIAKARKYTVQAGAFKSEADADALSEKLQKKGYKISVFPFRTKKHEKLFKVMVGEFSSRKEAELLSVRLKKTEGLKTFVSFRP